eukprot:530298-Heterocapsa_arctica.AAC.1
MNCAGVYNDKNDEQIMDLSLYDVERLRDYLKVKEAMIYDMPTDGGAIVATRTSSTTSAF